MEKDKSIPLPHIAVDTNIIISLSLYEKYGDEVRNILEENYYDTSNQEVKNLILSNYQLRREFYDEKHGVVTDSLQSIALLFYNIRKNKVKVYVTKTVLGELGLVNKKIFKDTIAGRLYKCESEVKEFIEREENNITVLTVKDEDAEQFAVDKLKLAMAYVEVGAMDREYNSQLEDYFPSRDAEIVAEASLFGLFLITLNEKHFIHLHVNDNDGVGDFYRSTKIEEVNWHKGLEFPTNRMPHTDPPRPISLYSFITRFKLRYKNNKLFCTYPNINEETNEIEYNHIQ